MKRHWLMGLSLILVLGLMAQLAQAQTIPALTEIYRGDGLTFNYPAGWVVETADDGQIFLKSSPEVDTTGEIFASGQFAMLFILPSETQNFGSGLTPAKALASLTEFMMDEQTELGKIIPLEISGNSAAQVSISDPETEGGALAIAFGDQIMVIAYQSAIGESGDFMGVLLAIAETITLGTAPTGDPIAQWASEAVATSQYGSGENWSPLQATGEPNTFDCGDFTTAWASASATGKDKLTLYYTEPVVPQEINIHQTYNPGSIISVSVITAEGESIVIPQSADPVGNTPCKGVFTLPVTGITDPVVGVEIKMDQTLGGNWNEIDAVELIGVPMTQPITRQWASEATGTSQFGTSSWNFAQATGSPNTTNCLDASTAWASSSRTGQDSLALMFAEAVIPQQVHIHQTFNPGAIISVQLMTPEGEIITLPDSADPVGNTPCPGVFTLEISGVTIPVNGVIINLDQTLTGNWNEIDAVELVGSSAK